MAAKPPMKGADGVVSLETFVHNDHPVYAASERGLFLIGAATPPFQGGEYPWPHNFPLPSGNPSIAAERDRRIDARRSMRRHEARAGCNSDQHKCYKNKRGRICRLDAEEQSAHQMAQPQCSGDAQRESNNNEYHSLTRSEEHTSELQ